MTTLLSILLAAAAWITSPSSNRLMEEQVAQDMATGSTASQCLTLDIATEYQTIDGFGWMVTEGSAKLMKGIHKNYRAELIEDLYSVENGLGAQIVRVAIGACDLSESDYTYSMTKDETLANFSFAGPDADYLIPVLKEIKAVNPNIKIMAVPWTAPIWMKTNNSYVGGELKTQYYALYAQYFVKYLQAMDAEGLPVWAITPQNEPLHGGNNPSMTFTQETEFNFVENFLGPALQAAGYGHVKIIGYDHNCDNKAFPVRVAQSQYCDGSAFHLYNGTIDALSFVYNRTGKDVYFTEQYTGDGDFQGDFSWHMQNVMLGSMLNMSRCAIEWNLASDAQLGPHTDGGCTTCKGAVTIGTKVTSKNASYYIVAAMAKVCRTGAKRIAVSGASDFMATAWHNPDGSIGVVAYNKAGSGRQFSVKLGNEHVTYTVPAGGTVSILLPEVADPFDTALNPTAQAVALDPTKPMYTLLGQPVDEDYHGLVIQGGRKYMK